MVEPESVSFAQGKAFEFALDSIGAGLAENADLGHHSLMPDGEMEFLLALYLLCKVADLLHFRQNACDLCHETRGSCEPPF